MLQSNVDVHDLVHAGNIGYRIQPTLVIQLKRSTDCFITINSNLGFNSIQHFREQKNSKQVDSQ